MLETSPPRDETRFLQRLHDYVAGVLHIELEFEPGDTKQLPLFLNRMYHFFETNIVGSPCLIMVAPTIGATPADISKHVAQIEEASGGVVILATETMNASNRARLIAQGVAFIVPGNQLYIPHLAMDLRERFRRPERARGDNLSPAAQAVLFHHVLRRHQINTPTELADALRYSSMSIGRAFDELDARQLATVERHGREKTITYAEPSRTLINLAKTLLRRPARGVHGVVFRGDLPGFMKAGETALSLLTNLNLPNLPTFAIRAANWQQTFADAGIEDVNSIHDAQAIVETWHYDPRVLSDTDIVDPLSLYAQFWDHSDERVAQAADELLEQIPW